MPALLFALKYWRVIASIVGVVALLGGAGAYIAKVKHDAYTDGFNAAHQQCEDDKAKMETANQNAINKAAAALASAEQQIQQKDATLDDYEKALDLAAAKDPGAAQCGIGADSVRRLSSID